MRSCIALFLTFSFTIFTYSQDLGYGLVANDLTNRPMQDIAKPGYLQTITDPSFGTTIRRITNAATGEIIKPMYSTIQAWNADESYMIVYQVGKGHLLLNGTTYQFIKTLDVKPDDIEQLFWDFNNPKYFYYLEATSDDFIKYNVDTNAKEILVNLDTASGCNGNISLGNDVQMMSWNSDIISFRCDNRSAFYYKISTGVTTSFNINNINYLAPMPTPSGNYFYHDKISYNSAGNIQTTLNELKGEHSCMGKLANGNDAYFAVAFDPTSQGGCTGDIVAHDMASGECYSIISESQGYNYTQSGTHISALAHKNTQPGWVAASLVGYKDGGQNGQTLLDQELVIAKADKNNIKVYRIGHHRADEDQFDYWGEPHAVLSPTGTRVLFGSDWSGSDDGKSIDCYVVELPIYNSALAVTDNILDNSINIYPNPVADQITINNDSGQKIKKVSFFNMKGQKIKTQNLTNSTIDVSTISGGIYLLTIHLENAIINKKIVIEK
ncbi:T9SS type A sorting domain-containing protein [Aureibaculum sp. A20]|uniref:T9SS type A sorting domain-containing protein n=1 Tax=Aureibaculum flavum TaxID=2795986 RepID=A0ABS0WTL5_9FLAO|nr:T9SS type A sorting domain-containing protein [Aureibaculum flavum]MBJ2175335.1 T9SS type A sorting domain-containing protein [Aureibaculum flavum]